MVGSWYATQCQSSPPVGHAPITFAADVVTGCQNRTRGPPRRATMLEYLACWGVWALLFLALVVGLAMWMNSTPWD